MTEGFPAPNSHGPEEQETIRLLPEEILMRLADTLKVEIAPTVGDEYTRTQTHMASVILQRVAKQLSLAPKHAEAEASQLRALVADLDTLLETSPPPAAVADAFETVSQSPTINALGPLLRALHRWDDPTSKLALERIRVVLREDIDRRMEIAS